MQIMLQSNSVYLMSSNAGLQTTRAGVPGYWWSSYSLHLGSWHHSYWSILLLKNPFHCISSILFSYPSMCSGGEKICNIYIYIVKGNFWNLGRFLSHELSLFLCVCLFFFLLYVLSCYTRRNSKFHCNVLFMLDRSAV